MRDQAAQLREIARKREAHQPQWQEGKARFIAIASAKGGVGKSFVALALAEQYARNGAQVLLVDTNLNTPSLHVLTNTTPQFSVRDMLSLRVGEEQLMFNAIDENLQLLPNEAPSNQMNASTLDNAIFFLEQMQPLRRVFDVVVFDTHTGLDSWNLSLFQAAHAVVLMTTPEPTAIIDSYLLVKAASEFMELNAFHLLINQVLVKEQGNEAANKLNMALDHFLGIRLPLAGTVMFDLSVRKLMQEQIFPFSPHLKSKFMDQLQSVTYALPGISKSQNKEVAI